MLPLVWHRRSFRLLSCFVALLLPPMLLWFGVRMSADDTFTVISIAASLRPAAPGRDLAAECLSQSFRNEAISSEASNSTDARIYAVVVAAGVSDVRQVDRLPPDRRVELERQSGVDFASLSRVFKLYHSYLRAYNRCHFRLLRDPGPCTASVDYAAVIVVHSLPNAVERRMALRERLLRQRLAGYRSVFIIGRTEETSVETAVGREADAFGDIIWADFWEDYNNLTIKTLTMLHWVQKNCPLTRYLVKADDDVYLSAVNLGGLLTASANRSRAIFGSFSYEDGAFRSMGYKWYMPRYMYNKNAYPPFAHGPCYIITVDLLKDLNAKALSINYIHLEDVFIALCASHVGNISLINVPHFIASSCNVQEAVAYHGVTC